MYGSIKWLRQGFVVTGVSYYLQAWCVQIKGPVFLAVWSPLCFVLTTFCSSSLLGEIVHLGRYKSQIVLLQEQIKGLALNYVEQLILSLFFFSLAASWAHSYWFAAFTASYGVKAGRAGFLSVGPTLSMVYKMDKNTRILKRRSLARESERKQRQCQQSK